MHCMQRVSLAYQVYDCSASVWQQRRSLDPASASNKTVVEYLATVSPELELANGSLCKACFTGLRPTTQNTRPSFSHVRGGVWARD